MNLIDFYYYNIGEEPTNNEKTKTKKTLDYLKDNGYSDNEIIDIIKNIPNKISLSPNDLPDMLWKDSLIIRDKFYYHSIFHIIPPAPYYDPVNDLIVSNKFYIEMKIKFTIRDLINYFYNNFPIDISLRNETKDDGAIRYLLNKYKKIDFIEPIDFILYLIDEAVEQKAILNNILELSNYENNTYEYLKNKTSNAIAEKKNIIIWR